MVEYSAAARYSAEAARKTAGSAKISGSDRPNTSDAHYSAIALTALALDGKADFLF
jgi:hypothetical protein